MSQKTRKKRLKSIQSTNSLIDKQDSDIAKYFKDCLTFTSNLEENNKLPLDIILESEKIEDDAINNRKFNTTARPCRGKSKSTLPNLLIPEKKLKSVLTENTNSIISYNNQSNNNLGIIPSSAKRSQKSFLSLKSNKSNLFNNITQSFNSSKILSLQELSDISNEKRLELSSWGLPSLILEKYQARGVKKMFPWQVECLANHKILEEHKNLVYSAPTSAGKTLVAEFLVLKTVLERHKKAIFILPFVSVVREKMFYFQDLFSDSGVRVEGFMGGIAPAGGFSAVHIAIATIEKANSLINRLMEDDSLSTLGAVVIDELHLLGDPGRGYLLELLLTKLRYMSLNIENINIQLIGMSATLPNLPLIAEWLDAELYKTDFRPIPLNEQCKIGSSIFDIKLNLIRELEPAPDIVSDTDHIIQLCIETINGGHGVLIFCPTKNWCEKLAIQIASTFFQLGRDNTPNGQILKENIHMTEVQEILTQLEHSPVGLDSVLKRTVSFGVAFHHAGLTMDERDIIEGGFRVGSLKVLAATSTLSSGVNLPARRVIIRSPMFNGQLIDKLTYQQMIGRAGRMGKDTAGESILICKSNERKAATNLMMSTLEPIVSCLMNSGPLIRALLEAIASQIVRTPTDLEFYSKCTFVYKCDDSEVKDMVQEAVHFLIANEFLLVKNAEGQEQRMVATCLGKACLSASIPPRDGLFLFEELQRARKCFVLDTELHVVYLVTPFNASSQINQIDWMMFLELWKSLPESERRVGQLVGVEDRFLMTAMRGIVKPGKLLNIHRRFYTALALHDLVREVPLNTVCRKYNCCRGLLQSLQQTSSTFAGMVTNFCKELKWDCMELLFAQFQARLQFGVCRDLLDLLRLPSLNGLRARSLYKHGITTVAELAAANEFDVEEALNKALPFESEKDFDGQNQAEINKKTKMRTVFITGKDGLTSRDAALIVIKEARELLKYELGVRDVGWSQNKYDNNLCSPHSSTKNAISPILLSVNVSKIDKVNNESMKELPKIINEKDDSCQTRKQSTSMKDQQRTSCSIIESASKRNISSTSDLTRTLKNVVSTSNNSRLMSDVPASRVDEKTDNISKENEILICTLDFQEKMDCREEKLPEKKCISLNDQELSPNDVNVQSIESLQVSDHVLGEVLQVVEKENKQEFSLPAPVSKSKLEGEKKRDSATSNYSNSPSLFSESSFIDQHMCSMLEKNVMDSVCMIDFEKSNFTPQNQSKTEIAHNSLIGNRLSDPNSMKNNAIKECNKISIETDVMNDEIKKILVEKTESNVVKPNQINYTESMVAVTWTEDSWDQTKNLRFIKDKDKEILDIGSPSLLGSKTDRRKKIIANNQMGFSKFEPCTSKEKSIEASLMGTPKSILRKRSLDSDDARRSPLAGIGTLKTRKPIKSTTNSSNKSDSEDSIISSQNVNSHQTINRTRNKIAQRLLMKTQQSMKLKELTTKVVCTAPKLTRQNSEPSFKNSSSSNSDSDSAGSGLLFESDDTIESQIRKSNKKKKSLSMEKNIEFTTTNAIAKIKNPDEKITLKSIQLVNVANSKRAFQVFRTEIEGSVQTSKKTEFSMALVSEPRDRDSTGGIGNKIISIDDKKKKKEKKNDAYVYGDRKLCGIVLFCGVGAVYYMPFSNSQETKVTIKERMSFLRDILTNPSISFRCFNTKEVYKMLYVCCEIESTCKFLDPKVGSWLMNSDICTKNYAELTAQYYPNALDVSYAIENNYDSFGISESSKAAAEAYLAWHINEKIVREMEMQSSILLSAYKDVEMPGIIILANMELRGFGINVSALHELLVVIKNDILHVEEKAFKLAGRKFNFYSSKDVSQVLGFTRKGRGCTNKNALKLCENPISDLITLWRKLSTVQTKIIFPLLQVEKKNDRIHGNCIVYTATGRISMHEPNLQTIPRDFKSEISECILSVRMAFIPTVGNLMLSADFCQLELRILAHFSEDPILCKLMHAQGDIFKNIAARLNKITEDKVNDDMRQRAKQLCYAMIYGMGTKSLAKSLSITESEAKDYLEEFMNTYKGIRIWINATIEQARVEGSVRTLNQRCRVFTNINSKIPAVKSQAERQAINTKIQGSAADVAKKAMVLIESKLRQQYSNLPVTFPATQGRRNLRSNDADARPRGAYLILQLHDELLYEVNSNDLHQVARIVKESMENAFKLRVPLPVKMKVGTAWGNLEEYIL